MSLLIDTRPTHRAAHVTSDCFRASVHDVPAGGVLLFPGVGDGIAPPAQLGPMMTPPGRAALFGR